MREAPSLKTIRVLGLSVLAFLLMLSYALARPAIESLFLKVHRSHSLPLVWMLLAVCMLATVAIYNRFVSRTDLLRLLGATAAVSAVLEILLLLACATGVPLAHYLLYIWKEIYVVMLVEIFYSFSNSVFPIRTARWVYSLFGALAAIGGLVGYLASGIIAPRFGSVPVLWLVVPVLLAVWLLCIPFARIAGAGVLDGHAGASGILDAGRVVLGSSYLLLVLLLIALVQVVITMIDFEYNAISEQVFASTDQRTGIFSNIYAALSVSTLCLHALTGPVLRLAGVPLTLLIIPLLLGSGLISYALLPGFFTVALVKVASKTFDYTVFRAAKELLYIPLTYEEKTKGKSIVDMITYRLAKASASPLLLVLLQARLARLVTMLTGVMIALWLLVTTVVVRRFRRKVSREHEMTSDQLTV